LAKSQGKRRFERALIVAFWAGRRAQITFLDVIHIRNHVWFGAVIS
jgi:hypothetical protein